MIRFVFLLVLIFQSSTGMAMMLTTHLSKWLDPALLNSRDEVSQIINSQRLTPIPCNDGEDWGFSFVPHDLDYLPISMVGAKFRAKGERIPVVDLGAGLGYNALNLILAGGKVDVVERQKDAAVAANSYIFKSLKRCGVPIAANSSKNFYRVFPHDLTLRSYPTNWSDTKHYLAVVNNLFHLLTPDQITDLLPRLFDNILHDGVVVVSSDTPYLHQSWINHYERANPTHPDFKGYAVYSKTKGDANNNPSPLGVPAEVEDGRVPGKVYDGHFVAPDDVRNPTTAYHTVRNLFKKEDLSALLVRAGFRLKAAYYLDANGNVVQDDANVRVGQPYRAYVIVFKD